MDIFIFDSLSRKKREFIPIDANKVRIYARGPTVYDYAHIGNARMAVVTDLLVRVLKKKYKNVLFVSNITDIYDKIINESEKLKIPFKELTNKFSKIYNNEMSSLNVSPPDIQPRANDHIDDIDQFASHINEYHAHGVSIHEENGFFFQIDDFFREKIKKLSTK